ncbi:zinc ribbon domain-containing protein [bacterium]|nr:zinc ribbon domain-containing protein [bacterium]
MPRSPLMRTIMSALGGLLGAVILLGVLAVANGGLGFVTCTGTARSGWIVPLVGGLVIAMASLLLLDPGRHADDDDAVELRASACASCGSPIIDEWRLCPHCGQLLECQVPLTSPMQATSRA